MSLTKCMLSNKLGGKINLAELKENAAAYEERGMSANDAMIRAVSEKVEALQLEEKKIISTVRDAYVAATGKKPAAAPVEESPKEQVSLVDEHAKLMDAMRDGTLDIDTFKQSYQDLLTNEEAVKAELNGKTRNELLDSGGAFFADRNKNEKKDYLVKALYRAMIAEYTHPSSQMLSYGMGAGAYENAVTKMVNSITADDLKEHARKIEEARSEHKKAKEARAAGIADPKTLEDFTAYAHEKMREGMTFGEARMTLNQDQRAKFDELMAEKTRGDRASQKEARQESVIRAPGEAVGATEIIKTQHTKHGHDLYQFNLEQRVTPDEFKSLLTQAKTLGGSYSSYRGNGAIPGWQFRTEEAAKAFKALISGDTTGAKEVMQARRDAFADDRSQSAVERLNEMAGALEERANESLNQERKTNTARRAGQANRAEAAAREGIAMAKTMRNIADAIDAGKAKFLDRVRHMSQVAALNQAVATAKFAELKQKYPSNKNGSRLEEHLGEPPTAETADHAEFPSYTAYRSDLASLGRQLIEVDGTKKLGQQIMKVADDVSKAYLDFAKENLTKVARFTSSKGGIAAFSTAAAAENAISVSGYKGKAIPFQVKRGEYTIILSPSEAQERKVWEGDGDKRITLTADFGKELVEKIGKAQRRGSKVSVPWQFEASHDRRQMLARMGIETPAEYRAALREFIALKETAKEADKVKQLERAMVGRRNDGMDFFPTPAGVADEMVQVADIKPGMSVLEPSAGMGHIAERIRESGVEPDVVEMSGARKELLEAKGFDVVGSDFMDVTGKQYDRIIMNPPFSDRRDVQHVQHAYDLLKPGGRLVAIMGEGTFFGQDKKAQAFREWLDSVGGTDEKLDEGTFMDPSLPVNTGVNARMVVIDKPEGADTAPAFDRGGMFSIGMDQSELQSHVDSLTKSWKNAPKINVVQSISDLPFESVNNARGAYYDKQVWLVADNIERDVDAQAVLFHEVLGHAGIRGMFGDKMMVEMRALSMKNEWIRTAAAKWREVNATLRGERTDEQWHSLSVEEVLAHVAGEGRTINGVEKFLAAVQSMLRTMGFNALANWMENKSNAEAMKLLANARKYIEYGAEQSAFGEQEAAAYNIGKSESADPLKALSEHDELFKLPKSTKTTVEGIAADNDAGIKVQKVDIPGEVMYKMTMPDGNEARLMVRKHNPYGDTVYGFKMVDGDMHAITEGRPGKNAEAVHGKDDVYIDVVDLDEGSGYGAKMYNIAATYAHNTGKVFIGDPAGLSDQALRRRPEQMLSSALKFGTTEHLGPHPRQVEGDSHVGVPALDWVYGDHVGNIKKLIDVNQKNIENAGGNGGIAYNEKTGQFEDSDGKVITRKDINGMAKAGLGRAAEAGGSTLARHALFKSILQREGKGLHGSDGILSALGKQLRDHDSARLDSPFREILYSRTTDSLLGKLGVQQNIRDNVSDLFQSEKTFNGWWHKTIGTQYHKAQIDKHFKRVYDATQRYLSSVSAFANEAADLAPSLLPKLDGLSDLTKKSANKADTTAAGNAIFQGTLTDQKVYSDAELRSKFHLTDKQITMYREFRAATDKSLDDMGKTDILRYAGQDGGDVTDQVLSAPDVTAGADILAKHLDELGQQDAAKVIREKANHIAQLKQEGYAPLMRFGEHTVYVTDKDGNQLFFGMAETGREAAQLARDMQETYSDAQVVKGILSTEGAKLFSGISPDTIEVFAKTTGLDKNPLFQDYLKLVVNNRSALKRLIQRKGVAGFSQDTTRVLASFLTSNARASSKNLHAGEMTQAANDIPKEKGDVRDEAIKLVDYIQNPVEEAAKIRGLLFTNFIGGSIASAAVNMTQPVMMTLPYLAQFGGVGATTKILMSAMKTAATTPQSEKIADPKLRTALLKAEAEGIVSPQEIHNLQAEAMKTSKGINIGGKEIVSSHNMRKMALVWGGLFGLAEQFNRKATFIAAYQVAQNMTPAQFEQAGVKNAEEFAAKAIAETQGVYNRGNRPDWARGALGATLMTFKQYSISYMEFLTRLPPKERALALAILVVAAGANGLPFADDLDDIIDTIAQSMGYNWNTKKVKDRFVTNTLGRGASEFLLHGFSGVGGMPLDVSMRMGMGNLLPGTGALKKSNKDKGDDVAEFFGAAGGYGKKLTTGAEKLLDGDVPGALKAVVSTAASNLIKAVDMMHTDTYRDMRGRKVTDTDTIDALVKAVGFQPGKVAHEQKRMNMIRQDIDLANSVKAGIAEKWAQGIFEKDPRASIEAVAAVRAWNAKNPESRITVSPASVAARVREMRMTKQDRVIKHAPKSMRAGIIEEFSN